MTRTTILRGPALVQYDSADIFTKGDITVEIEEDTFEIVCSPYGKVDERVGDRIARVRFTPVGEWESPARDKLMPYASTLAGASLFTGTDKPLVIQEIASSGAKKMTFQAAAVTRMPNLVLAAKETIFEEVEFTCLQKDNTPWTTADSFIAVASNATPASTFSVTATKTLSYTGQWGTASDPWNPFQTHNGFRIEFDLRVTPLVVDPDGTIDFMFESLGVMARCAPIWYSGGTPSAFDESDILAALELQGASAFRGQSLQDISDSAGLRDLVIVNGASPSFTLKYAAPKQAGFVFGATAVRIGEVGFVATRKISAGVLDPLFTMA